MQNLLIICAEITTPKSPWDSLEVVKLVVSALTPILLAGAGFYLNERLKIFEHRQWRNQKLIEKRLVIYDELAPLLNDILCYFTYIGGWKEQKPADIIALKRTIDKQIYLASPLFCKEFFSACMNLMNLCYSSYTGWGRDAQLRSKFDKRQYAFGAEWQVEWNKHFCIDNCAGQGEIKTAYQAVMNIFSSEIGLKNNEPMPAGQTPLPEVS